MGAMIFKALPLLAANCRPFLKSVASLTVATTALAVMGSIPSMCINREADSLAPEGLTALRANREEFPIEATISPFESAGQRYYTIILRVLDDTDWLIEGQRGAAAILGLSPSTLRSRLQKLGIKRPRSRPKA
jgi:transcriptional regulator with GAF, ATPase, and Fis domain